MIYQLPKHNGELCITHNEHKSNYQTVKEYVGEHGPDFWASHEEMHKAINCNEMWSILWYPDTPVAFCKVSAATFEVALEIAMRYKKG
jgi:hypothetical protein